jgi:hypothetical protein
MFVLWLNKPTVINVSLSYVPDRIKNMLGNYTVTLNIKAFLGLKTGRSRWRREEEHKEEEGRKR